ncbi:MAG: hypothetical protein EOM20_15690 [Spartobacteria bacterium]|nr:hypothetical protein [Spartobacteria bacterium]
MNIKPVVYENLTHRQRVIASIEALSREDEAEARRLVKTCPKKNYTMNDSAYVDRMEALLDLAMSVECDLRGLALKSLMEAWLGDREKDFDGGRPISQPAMEFMCDMLALRQAWHELLEDEGIEPKAMERVSGSMRHDVVNSLLRIAEKFNQEPDPDTVAYCKTPMMEYLAKI